MMNLSKPRHNCYCAFCKSPRRISRKRSIGLLNVLGSVVASAVIMMALWQEFDPRVMVVFIVCLVISETFVKIRWRLSVPCRQCGFDPVLYLKNPELAAAKVKGHLEIRRTDGNYLLSKPLNLPTIAPAKAKALEAKEKGRLVSRSI